MYTAEHLPTRRWQQNSANVPGCAHPLGGLLATKAFCPMMLPDILCA
jgi:hypothetical protein